ncbi:MAG: type V CRISPR-associated protein Cas12a/Cpf1 [Saprospiraceae bacterium]|nr:type V CRISPR-associated protein Cas12a/Cpf1 [Saprospiraceae bacterium]
MLDQFTNLYSLSKTIKFELIPQGETLKWIEKKQLITIDKNRADEYKYLKKIIDKYHIQFINNALDGFRLTNLESYFELYKIQDKNDEQKKEIQEIQNKLRKQIADRFSKHPKLEIQKKYKNLFGKELINIDLKEFVETEIDKSIVDNFEKFTTYFTGFNENRKNMYTAEDKSTAISYRLIHQNLPKFIDNLKIFEKLKESEINSELVSIQNEIGNFFKINNINEVFQLDYFNEVLSQTGIDIYNQVIGGYTTNDGKTKIKGLNEYINLFNQNVKDKKNKIGKFKLLFKQILSDRNTASFILEEFKNDHDVLQSIDSMYQELNTYVFDENNSEIISLQEIINRLSEYDLNKIFIRNDISITDISQKLYGSWTLIGQALANDYDLKYKGKLIKGTERYETEQTNYIKKQDSFSIQYLNDCLKALPNNEQTTNLTEYFILLGENKKENIPNLIEQIKFQYKNLEEQIKTYSKDNNLTQDQTLVEKIKLFLDTIKALQWFVKPLLGKGIEPEKDIKFYGDLDKIWSTIDQITPLYNKVRNYVTKKPYNTEKIKLNFENSTLLNGWDENKEEANSAILFKKDENFYLGIMDKNSNKIFRKIPKPETNQLITKITYKLLPSASQNLPRIFFAKKNINTFAPSARVLNIRNHASHTKNGTPQDGCEKHEFNLDDCHAMIDFFKESIDKHKEWSKFGFKFTNTRDYKSIDEFYREVESQGYSITYKNIDNEYINELVSQGKLYYFQIYNKDFSSSSKGNPNMHTIYWKMLFDENNLRNIVYKLNGQAEIFFRKSSIKPENTIIHKEKYPISNKNTENQKKESQFEYDIIKDRRYTIDKFQFHVPITMNFKADGKENINERVNIMIKKSNDLHVIGIDRGERHLLYLTVLDTTGKLIEQFSLNDIVNEFNGKVYKTNYKYLLETKEGDRAKARLNWKTIENIKELKEGYLSQVIHKICELIKKYNAIVVLEDLNFGFVRGRQKVEKQVYQKFEKMLIDKLNYYVDKNLKPNDTGGCLNALQLTSKFISFQKMGKQSGWLFYVPAWNTSKIDPTTGFVNLFNTNYENTEKAKEFINNFNNIKYNNKEEYFEFEFDYSLFSAKAEGTINKWTICSYGDRVLTFRNELKNNTWDNKIIKLTPEWQALCNKFKIDFKSGNLKSDFLMQTSSQFYKEFLQLFKLTLQMRNSITNSDVDYLISPVKNLSGKFYDSRMANEYEPKDADANGAYNIGRKGLWVIEQIKKAADLRKLNLAISNKEWLNFAQRNR